MNENANLISQYMAILGRKGAKALKEKKGKDYFKELAKKRWAKVDKLKKDSK